MTLKDQHGVTHVLAATRVEEAELLLAMGGIIGGVDIEQDLAELADLLATDVNRLIEQGVVQPHQAAGGRRILQAAQHRLRAERFSQLLIGNDLSGRVMTLATGIVSAFVAGHDLINALA